MPIKGVDPKFPPILFKQVANWVKDNYWKQLVNLLERKEARDVAAFRAIFAELGVSSSAVGVGLLSLARGVNGKLASDQQIMGARGEAVVVTDIWVVPSEFTSVTAAPRVTVAAKVGSSNTTVFGPLTMTGFTTARRVWKFGINNQVSSSVAAGETLFWTNSTVATGTKMLFDVYVFGFPIQ